MLFAAPDADTAIAILGCTGVFILAALITYIFFLITLMKALQECSFHNQMMAPGLVWLNFVPLLNLVWQFIVVVQVGNSLKKEYEDRGLRSSDDSFGKGLGITYLALNLISACVNLFGQLAFAGARAREGAAVFGCLVLVMGLVSFILWIVYWAKIAGFTRELNAHGGRSDRYVDDYDRPRGRDHDRDYDRDDERRRDDYDRQGDGGLPHYPGS